MEEETTLPITTALFETCAWPFAKIRSVTLSGFCARRRQRYPQCRVRFPLQLTLPARFSQASDSRIHPVRFEQRISSTLPVSDHAALLTARLHTQLLCQLL